MRQAVDQPGLGHGLHPCADQRNDLPSREQTEITVAQRTESLLDTVQLAWGRDSGERTESLLDTVQLAWGRDSGGKLLKDQRRGCPLAPRGGNRHDKFQDSAHRVGQAL